MIDFKMVKVKIIRPDGAEAVSINVPDVAWVGVIDGQAKINCLNFALGMVKQRVESLASESPIESGSTAQEEKNGIDRVNIINHGNVTIKL